MSWESTLDCFCANEELYRRYCSLEGCHTDEQCAKIRRIIAAFDREFPDCTVEPMTEQYRHETMKAWHDDWLAETTDYKITESEHYVQIHAGGRLFGVSGANLRVKAPIL